MFVVIGSVCRNFLKGREVALLYSYRSTCYFREEEVMVGQDENISLKLEGHKHFNRIEIILPRGVQRKS